MKKIVKRRVVWGVAAVVAVAGLVVSCQEERRQGGAVIAPVANTPATQGRGVAHTIPGVGIRMEKPRVLGPVLPAVVMVPETMAEPVVRVRLTEEEDRPPVVRKGAYRGRVETVRLADGKYVAVNSVPMDAYLAGVLPKELYPSWGIEAYRAQAIAARTFALFEILAEGKGRQWDVANDESSQMYGGIAGETAKSREAVAETRGMVLMTTMKGADGVEQAGIFCSYYSACIGGATQDPFEAWGDPTVGPLAARKVGTMDENCPKYAWPVMTVTKADIGRCIRSWGERNGFGYLQALGPIQSVVIAKRNVVTGRPTELMLTDVRGKTAPIRAEEFRLALVRDPLGAAPKPFSSNFSIRDAGEAVELFNGKGYGHGIGLSQWGAEAMAVRGYTYGQILEFYYPGARLKELW